MPETATLGYESYRLHFRKPFALSRGVRNGTDAVFVHLQAGSLSGYGEAALPPYLATDEKSVREFLSTVDLHHFTPNDPGVLLDRIAARQPRNAPAMAALDMALHDLAGKYRGIPCSRMFGHEGIVSVPTFYTISLADAGDLEATLAAAAPFRILKIKAGGPGDKAWVERVHRLSGKRFCVDANQGWQDRDEVLELLHYLHGLGAVFVEQPLPPGREEDMRWLKSRSPVPLVADESFQRQADLEMTARSFHGVNVKLMKCGGLRAGASLIRAARATGLKVLLGCMSESSCGVAAAAALAPMADWVDLDGPLLIDNDPFEGITYRDGNLVTSGRPGLGIMKKP
jgi:L-alanine-DL-glutamate epimerase-like enolase superfamily enzyme